MLVLRPPWFNKHTPTPLPLAAGGRTSSPNPEPGSPGRHRPHFRPDKPGTAQGEAGELPRALTTQMGAEEKLPSDTREGRNESTLGWPDSFLCHLSARKTRSSSPAKSSGCAGSHPTPGTSVWNRCPVNSGAFSGSAESPLAFAQTEAKQWDGVTQGPAGTATLTNVGETRGNFTSFLQAKKLNI